MSLDSKLSENIIYNKPKIFSILIVDDDIDFCKKFKKNLEIRGHSVIILTEGMIYVSKCINNHFDLIFMDFHIKDIDGDKVTTIKEDFNNRSIIFAYTGDKSDQAIESFKKNSMNGVIIKPLDMDLFNNIMSILEKDIKNIDRKSLERLSKKSKGNIIIF